MANGNHFIRSYASIYIVRTHRCLCVPHNEPNKNIHHTQTVHGARIRTLVHHYIYDRKMQTRGHIVEARSAGAFATLPYFYRTTKENQMHSALVESTNNSSSK